MTRKHYDSPKLTRYERRKRIRRSVGYRFRRRSRQFFRRLDELSGWIRMWLLVTLGAYFMVVIGSGPGSGLLPPPWDEIVCGIGGAALTVWQGWATFSAHAKEQAAKLEKHKREFS